MSDKPMRRILVTGAAGQIGSELTLALRERYGVENVIATDLQKQAGRATGERRPLCLCGCDQPREHPTRGRALRD